MNLPIIGEILNGLGKAADGLITSDHERLQMQAKLEEVKNDLEKAILENEAKIMQSRENIIVAEAKSESYMARNWRPILMLSITGILIANYILFPVIRMFGVKNAVDLPLPTELWALIITGVNGYIHARTFEKSPPAIVELVKKKPKP